MKEQALSGRALSGRTIIVLGAAGGLGHGVTERLRADGASVLAADIEVPAAAERQGTSMFSADLSTRRFNSSTVVALRGELDLADAPAVTAALTAVAARDTVIIVDLAGLEFIDSSGVAALARGRTRARQAGGDLVLAAPQRRVMRVLAIIRMNERFSVYATVKQAGRFRQGPVPVPVPRHPDPATCRLSLVPAAAGPEA